MKMHEIHIRDPYILPDKDKYYMYGSRGKECWGKCTGLDVYVSDDLVEWSEPIEVFTKTDDFWSDMHYWAPEVHVYHNSYYMFVSLKSNSCCRGVQILKANSPLGPYLVHSDGPVTPDNWECLDGTLYINKGKPYMVFCHEWQQVKDGEMCAIPLSDDLKECIGEPVLLFKASQPLWADTDKEDYVTDGPFLYKTAEGRLLMIWSSFSNGEYCEAIAYSENGDLLGEWKHEEQLLFDRDGGHGMIFRTRENQIKLVLHRPNNPSDERPCLLDLCEKDGFLRLIED